MKHAASKSERGFSWLGRHYLRAEHPKEDHVDRRKNDEEKVVFPADGGEPGSGRLEEWQGRQEEYCNAPAHAFGTNVGGEDFGAVDVDGGIDKACIAKRVWILMLDRILGSHEEHTRVTYKQI